MAYIRLFLTLHIACTWVCCDNESSKVIQVDDKVGESCLPREPVKALDAWRMQLPSAGPATIIKRNRGGFTDIFLKSPISDAQIGIRKEWGGSVVFFGDKYEPARNTIDANDTGRELQIAIYDNSRLFQGCAYDASCKPPDRVCDASITYLGWNPVQGGDECNRGGKVTGSNINDEVRDDDALEIIVKPRQWNPDWKSPTCENDGCSEPLKDVGVTFKLRFRFVESDVVEISMEVVNDEDMNHVETEQEFPTLYVANNASGLDLDRLFDSEGKRIELNTQAKSGAEYSDFNSKNGWVAWTQPAQKYGMGIAMDQMFAKFRGIGGDGSKAPYFHSVRPQFPFALASKATVRGRAYIALGDYDHIKERFDALIAKRAPFGELDSPLVETSIGAGEPLNIQGWVLDNRTDVRLELLIDGVSIDTLAPTENRSDVCALYPNYKGCPNAGFKATLDTTNWSSCAHLLEVVAIDSDANRQTIGERKIAVQ